ncbi:glycosyltransferase [Corynebacterium sp. H113]|uniref:glycosyltransferase n=1 Tax=Corynebacterium sp. H113 TaxID=3133419 RepID=UPI0030B71D3C
MNTAATSTDELTIQRVLFAPPAEWVNPELYFNAKGAGSDNGSLKSSRSSLTMGPHTVVTTDTYFGRFRASHWQRWTTVDEVIIRARVVGAARVLALTEDIGGHIRMEDSWAAGGSDVDGNRTADEDRLVNVNEDVELRVPLDRFADGGAIFLQFDTQEEGARISDVRFTVPTSAIRNDVPTDLVICTYNRPVDCARTVATLAEDLPALERVRTIRVVDQGDKHPADEADFAAAQEKLGDRLNVVAQPNLGGAGGFSRGMRDAVAAGDCMVLLTDDDIRPEPETTLRLSALACCAEKPMLLGAQMLFLYNPTNLFRTGETYNWANLTVCENDPVYGLADKDVREHHQLRRLGVEYNAWWTCLIPSQVIKEIGLALPLFFQYDDIDFGFRAAKAGYTTDTIPGAAVWHADFYWKDIENPAQYFGLRNGLIAAAMHGDVSAKDMANVVSRRILTNLVSMRYGLAWTQLEAVRDMLTGPSVLDAASQGDFARISKGRGDFAETKLLPLAHMPGGLTPVRPPTREIASENKVLAKRVAYTQMDKKRPGPVAIAYEDAFWWHISQFDEVWVTDASQSGVHHLVRDTEKEKQLRNEMIRVTRRLTNEWETIREQWRSAADKLVSEENWEPFFNA